MKSKFILGLLGLTLGVVPAVLGQPAPLWENWGIYQIPPPQDPIDAVTVVNHKGASFTTFTSGLFNSYDTMNYTNEGLMVGNPGFDFENIPSGTGQAKWASSWVNRTSGLGTNSGVINCNGVFSFILTPQLPAGNLSGSSKCLVYATNIINSGYINMSASSLIKLRGNNIDLSRGAIMMANPSDFLGFFTAGELDGYWGVGEADYQYFQFPSVGQASLLNPARIFQNFNGSLLAVPDIYNIVLRISVPAIQQLVLVNPQVYTLSWLANGGSNILTQVVVVQNTNNAVTPTVYFDPAEVAVQWQWAATNFPTGDVSSSNYLFLLDDFGEITNLQVGLNGFAAQRPTYMPVNYLFLQGSPYVAFNPFAIRGQPVVPGQVPFIPGIVTNDYSAYQGIFGAGTALPEDTAGGNVTNMAGRIEITADKLLNLTNARLSSLNYMLIQATNHYLGSKGAAISSPNMDIYLRTTNGMLAITNLVAPYLNHVSGTCDLWSARWTNVVNSITNSFHVLFVRSALAPVTKPFVQTLNLNVTNFSGAQNNLVVSDVLNVTSNLLLRADSLTLTTNAGNIFAPVAQLNIDNPDIVWSTALPGLMYLTNYGRITAQNAVYFGGSRSQPPYYTNIVDVPYHAFVNHGGITNQADLIWSQFFLNDGIFDCGEGSFNLQKACTVLLTNGLINAPGGDISLTACSLLASNHALLSGGALTLAVTNVLDDGSLASSSADNITNKNFWTCADGVHLLTLPTDASLLGTTISNTAANFALVPNHWAGADLGNTPAGFANNAALGRLILEGITNCYYEFSPVTGNNALYVDRLDLRDFVASNVDGAGNWVSLFCDPGMKVYFGQALADGRDISEKLSAVNNGRFIWVSNYNTGFYSSTNVIYTDGSTNRLNTALVTSCDIDSNGNGIPNCMDRDPIPVLSPHSFALSVSLTNGPAKDVVVSWFAFPGTTNTLLSASSSTSTNWTVVTNFLYSGPFPGRVSVTDPVRSSTPKFYRVRAILQ